jgi:hypothetical protein
MAGISLRCTGFIEAESFEGSKQILKDELAERGETITDRQIDDRLEAMEWALERGDRENVAPIGTRSLWVYVLPGAYPALRVYLRPRPDFPAECELLWIEERLL